MIPAPSAIWNAKLLERYLLTLQDIQRDAERILNLRRELDEQFHALTDQISSIQDRFSQCMDDIRKYALPARTAVQDMIHVVQDVFARCEELLQAMKRDNESLAAYVQQATKPAAVWNTS